MGWLLELLLDGIREICSQFIVDMMELVTEMFTELLSCNLSLFEELFSVVSALYKNVIVPMGMDGEAACKKQQPFYGRCAHSGRKYGVLRELLESDGGIRKNLLQVDDIYERYYYVPMCPEATVQLWLLLDESKRNRLYRFLCGILSYRRDKEYAIYDGYDSRGEPVYFCHELEMRHLLRVKQEAAWQHRGTVLCLDYQEAALREYFGEGIKIQMVITERLREYLQQDA